MAAKEACTSTITTPLEKSKAMLKLQQACEAVATREKKLSKRLTSKVAHRADRERKILEAREMYEANVTMRKMALEKMKEKYDTEMVTTANLKKALLKAEALHAEEVAKAADREKGLAKVEATHAKMVVKLSEKDQSLDKLWAKLAKPTSSWKKASTQVEATITAHVRLAPMENFTAELKDHNDLIMILLMKLRAEKSMIRKLHAQLQRVIIMCNCA
jgi:seryl-tRNA synthetase